MCPPHTHTHTHLLPTPSRSLKSALSQPPVPVPPDSMSLLWLWLAIKLDSELKWLRVEKCCGSSRPGWESALMREGGHAPHRVRQ